MTYSYTHSSRPRLVRPLLATETVRNLGLYDEPEEPPIDEDALPDVGDTLICDSEDDMINKIMELRAEGIKVEILRSYGGVDGYYLEITEKEGERR